MLTNNPDKIVSTNPALPVAPRDRLSIPPPPPPPPVILHFPTSKIILSSTQENSYIKFLKPIEIRRELYRGGIVVVVVVVDNGQEWGKGGRSGIARPDLPQRLRLTEGRGEGTIHQRERHRFPRSSHGEDRTPIFERHGFFLFPLTKNLRARIYKFSFTILLLPSFYFKPRSLPRYTSLSLNRIKSNFRETRGRVTGREITEHPS